MDPHGLRGIPYVKIIQIYTLLPTPSLQVLTVLLQIKDCGLSYYPQRHHQRNKSTL